MNETEENKKNPAELTEEEQKYLPFAWRLLAGTDNGKLSVRYLGRILRGFGKNPSEQEVHFLIYENGLNENHSLGYEEVLPLYIKCKSEVSTVSQLKAAFKVFDPDNTGKITADDLRDILTRLGENMTTFEFEQLCKKADRAQTGVIVYEDFCKLIMGDNRPVLK